MFYVLASEPLIDSAKENAHVELCNVESELAKVPRFTL
jgi:hypothetical protein